MSPCMSSADDGAKSGGQGHILNSISMLGIRWNNCHHIFRSSCHVAASWRRYSVEYLERSQKEGLFERREVRRRIPERFIKSEAVRDCFDHASGDASLQAADHWRDYTKAETIATPNVEANRTLLRLRGIAVEGTIPQHSRS